MYIYDSGRKAILNSAFFGRFSIVEKEDAALIVASTRYEERPITIGKYLDKKEASGALDSLFSALAGEQGYFEMPDSALFHGDAHKYDARTKRKGGS